MPRTIGIDEVLKLVPGVKVDNQADGERVHLSIRGQGILTERGTHVLVADTAAFPIDFWNSTPKGSGDRIASKFSGAWTSATIEFSRILSF